MLHLHNESVDILTHQILQIASGFAIIPDRQFPEVPRYFRGRFPYLMLIIETSHNGVIMNEKIHKQQKINVINELAMDNATCPKKDGDKRFEEFMTCETCDSNGPGWRKATC